MIMKGKAIIPLALGLCVGLVAVKFLVDFVKKAQGSTGDQPTVTVFRAAHDIDAFVEITEELLDEFETTDASFIPASERIADKEELLGRVSQKQIPQRSPIFNSMLAPTGTTPGMVGRIPSGFRAVSVKIDEVSGVAYQLKPGVWVDVIAVMDVDNGDANRRKSRRQTVAEVILQKVKIVAIGRATAGPAGGSNDGKVKPAKSATLLVRKEDAPKLHLAQTKGKITLSMRGDDEEVTEEAITAGDDAFEALRNNVKKPPAPAPKRVVDAKPTMRRADVPYSMVVYHRASSLKNSNIQRITFQDLKSRAIIGVQNGPIDRSLKANPSARNRMDSYRATTGSGSSGIKNDNFEDANTRAEEE